MNAKIIKTKQALLNAFCRLAETTSIEEITVTQLCQEAGINRTTFYRYYSIPMDVILQKAEELTQAALGSVAHPMESTYEFIFHICNCYYENRKVLSIGLKTKSSLLPVYYDTMMRGFPEVSLLADPVNNFIAGGMASTIMAWVMTGCTTPPEQMATFLFDCIKKISNTEL